MIKHIYFFASRDKSCASARYRGIYVLRHLHDFYNISSSFVYPGYSLKAISKFISAYLSVLLGIRKNSLVIYQKLHTNGIYIRLLKLLLSVRRARIIYDLDDADYLRYDKTNIEYFMKNCSQCTVGSQALYQRAKLFNNKISLLTSSLADHTVKKYGKNEKLSIGWVGDFGFNYSEPLAFSHKRSIYSILFPALKNLEIEIKLTLLGVKNPSDKIEIEKYFKQNTNIDLEIPLEIDWEDDLTLFKKVKEFDIGVSPLVNHEFNVAKSAFKVKQYLSCGVPVLASPIGENVTFIKDHYNGYLCSTSKDFFQRIMEISKMKSTEYKKLMINANNPIEDFYLDSYCEKLLSLSLSQNRD